jgi:cytochrome c553
MKHARAICLIVVVAGCPAPAPPAPQPDPASAPAPAASPPPTALHGHMQKHVIQLEHARQSLIKADLAESRDALRWLATHEPPAALPVGWAPHVLAMQTAAKRGAEASTLADVGDAVGAVAVACGACHEANSVKLDLPDVELPTGDVGSKGHMARHTWAADRMWEGLLMGSAAHWARGARLLHESPLGELQGGGDLPETVSAFGARVHAIGVDALPEQDPDKRGALYGDFLAQCGSCHQKTGAGP